MTEADEVAEGIYRKWLDTSRDSQTPGRPILTMSDAMNVVRPFMPDETATVLSNTAYALLMIAKADQSGAVSRHLMRQEPVA